jgi:hypothetical protein
MDPRRITHRTIVLGMICAFAAVLVLGGLGICLTHVGPISGQLVRHDVHPTCPGCTHHEICCSRAKSHESLSRKKGNLCCVVPCSVSTPGIPKFVEEMSPWKTGRSPVATVPLDPSKPIGVHGIALQTSSSANLPASTDTIRSVVLLM